MSDKKSLEELKILVFEQDQATKQNKDRLFKLAKASNDIETIQKLADQYGFKSANVYLDRIDNLSVEDALINRDFDLFKKLVDEGTDVSKIKTSDLIDKKYDDKFVYLFLEKGFKANISKLISNNYSHEIINIAIQNGSNVNVVDDENISALINACRRNKNQIVELLLSNGANPNTKNKFGETALSFAVDEGNVEIVKMLLEVESIDVDIQNKWEITPLIKALKSGLPGYEKSLFDWKPELKKLSSDEFKQYLNELIKKHSEIAEMLIIAGANINSLHSSNSLKLRPLNYALLKLDYKLAKLLINKGAKCEIQQLPDFFHKIQINSTTNISQFQKEVVDGIKSKEEALSLINDIIEYYDISSEIVEQLNLKEQLVDYKSSQHNKPLIIIIDKLCKQELEFAKTTHEGYFREALQHNHFNKLPVQYLEGIAQHFLLGIFERDEYQDISYNKYDNPYIKRLLLKKQMNEKVFVDVYKNTLLFNFESIAHIRNTTEYKKIEENLYYDQKHGTIMIVENYLVEKPKQGGYRISEFDVVDEFNNIVFDLDLSKHNPKKLVKLLTNFTDDKPMKYTTHSWDFGDLKKEYGSFEGYLKAVKTQWYSIKEDLAKLSPNLYRKVHDFLWEHDDAKALGWSSVKGLNEWCDNDNDPFPYQINHATFGEIKDAFKNQIEIRKEQDKLEDIFIQERKKLGRDFKVETVKLKGKTFYTDVEKFKMTISRIFRMITLYSKDKDGNIVYPNIKVEAIEYEHSRYLDIYIVHIDSFTSSSIKDMKKETIDGDFKEIKKNLQNLCDWSIQNSYEDDSYQINYLKSEYSEVAEKLQTKPEGFTHILRFYNK